MEEDLDSEGNVAHSGAAGVVSARTGDLECGEGRLAAGAAERVLRGVGE
jgi:hypothetical protein